jgi:Zn-dependent peptidase ImmA (M78 family)
MLSRFGQVRGERGDIAPAIWYKLRAAELTDGDREFVLVIRQLGYHQDRLEEVTGRRAVVWKTFFKATLDNTDLQAPPREQGRQAARIFRESTGLAKRSTGIGRLLRDSLRSAGVLVIETPLPGSGLGGCCFYVGSPASNGRPCIFANTFHSTWYRRNAVLTHELAHAVFDAQHAGASLDFIGQREDGAEADLAEERAHAFAQEMLVPREVLLHAAQACGIRWSAMTEQDLALMVAKTQVELRTLLRAAVDAGLLEPQAAAEHQGVDIALALKELDDSALSTEEYVRKIGVKAEEWRGKRTTTIPSRKVLLPVPYVQAVLQAVEHRDITPSKAAQMLMIDELDLEKRFGPLFCTPD